MSTNTPSIQPTVDSFHRVRMATRWVRRSSAIITAHGDLDASNAHEFVDHVLRAVPRAERLVLDLNGVDFFGTAGFSALHTVNVRCAADRVEWVMVPSQAVLHLLRICDPDSALPRCDSISAALDTWRRGKPRPLLQLIPKSR